MFVSKEGPAVTVSAHRGRGAIGWPVTERESGNELWAFTGSTELEAESDAAVGAQGKIQMIPISPYRQMFLVISVISFTDFW